MNKFVLQLTLCVLLCSVVINAASTFTRLDTGGLRVGKSIAVVGSDIFFSAGESTGSDTHIYKSATTGFPASIESLSFFLSNGTIEAVFSYKQSGIEYIGAIEQLPAGKNFTVIDPATVTVVASYQLTLNLGDAAITGASGLYDMGFIVTVDGDWEECIYDNQDNNVTCFSRNDFKSWVGVTGDQTIGFSVFYIRTEGSVDVFVGDRIDGSDDNDVNFASPNGQSVVGGVAWNTGALFYNAPSGGQTQAYVLTIAPPTSTTSPLNFTLSATVTFFGDVSVGRWVVDVANNKAYYIDLNPAANITVQILDLATGATICPLVIAGPVPQPNNLFVGGGSVFIGSSPVLASSTNSSFFQTAAPLSASADLACIQGNVTVVVQPTVAPTSTPTPTPTPTPAPTPANSTATPAPTPAPTPAQNATVAPTTPPTAAPTAAPTSAATTLTTFGVLVVFCVLFVLF